ncbi:unnamed protein product [Nezara viridula]|uniref:Neuropeptide n=1 Tax=Nezara viridula TaxID=85310 RepID=A0A9P0H0Q4_NEZVI|nr:unnamed protein product [Nezara viridula]
MLFSYLLLLLPEDCRVVPIFPLPTYGELYTNNNCIHFTYRVGKNCYHKIITSAEISPSGQFDNAYEILTSRTAFWLLMNLALQETEFLIFEILGLKKTLIRLLMDVTNIPFL